MHTLRERESHGGNIWIGAAKISTLYDVRAIPSTFLIDSAGIVRKVNLRGPAL